MAWNWISRLVLLSAVNNQMTVIVVESLLFKKVREWAMARAHWFGELVSCDLCFGTWVGFFLAIVFRPSFVEVPPLAGSSPEVNRWFRRLAVFVADSFAIALGGRLLNEILGLLQREVAVREEEKELLAEEIEQLQ